MSKKLYEQPTTKVLVVRVEGSLLTGSDPAKAYRLGGAGNYDDTLFSNGEDY